MVGFSKEHFTFWTPEHSFTNSLSSDDHQPRPKIASPPVWLGDLALTFDSSFCPSLSGLNCSLPIPLDRLSIRLGSCTITPAHGAATTDRLASAYQGNQIFILHKWYPRERNFSQVTNTTFMTNQTMGRSTGSGGRVTVFLRPDAWPLDREQVVELTCSISVGPSGEEFGGQTRQRLLHAFRSAWIRLELLDVNDNPPRFIALQQDSGEMRPLVCGEKDSLNATVSVILVPSRKCSYPQRTRTYSLTDLFDAANDLNSYLDKLVAAALLLGSHRRDGSFSYGIK
ncbi:unnamed protein product [Protopolystoma xenopodis]|uniref:Cadherin domain-containing protein n=1 Tax=Protopolystoma xenopodis TaxID=117903 RepID=A0A448WZF1_9PLAT|nr:unnamed protein product [Protopolystoma xenopodis]